MKILDCYKKTKKEKYKLKILDCYKKTKKEKYKKMLKEAYDIWKKRYKIFLKNDAKLSKKSY
jgi:hypothetical protein